MNRRQARNLLARLNLRHPGAENLGASIWSQRVLVNCGALAGVLSCILILIAAGVDGDFRSIDLIITASIGALYVQFLLAFNRSGGRHTYELMFYLVWATAIAFELFFAGYLASQTDSPSDDNFLLGAFAPLMTMFAYTYLLRGHARYLSGFVVVAGAAQLGLAVLWAPSMDAAPSILSLVIVVLLPLQIALVMELRFNVQYQVLAEARGQKHQLANEQLLLERQRKADQETGLMNLKGMMEDITRRQQSGAALSIAEIGLQLGGMTGRDCQKLRERMDPVLPAGSQLARSDSNTLLLWSFADDHDSFRQCLDLVCAADFDGRSLYSADIYETELLELGVQFILNELSARLLEVEVIRSN